MSRQANHHPDLNLLQDFFEGKLSMGFNMAISGHVDDCAACRQCVAELAVSTCNDWYEDNSSADVSDRELGDILSTIIDQPTMAADALLPEVDTSEGPLKTIQLHGRSVKMPHVLQPFVATAFHWKEIGKGIHQALIEADPTTKCEIIFMEPGARVPRHTHMGQEFMLVLDGSISDGKHSYGVADFVTSDNRVHHRQQTENGCVCLFITDAPLEFTEGLARLLNPINRAKHWWSGRKGAQRI